MPITLIGLDADDTLWHSETLFRLTQERFSDLLAPYAETAIVDDHLAAVTQRNLAVYGYGVKAFTLSMLETALELCKGSMSADVVKAILSAGRDLMRHPVEPLHGVADALERLAGQARLVLITKGDLFHQEAKLAGSGLGDLFSSVEVVSEKRPDTYRRIFERAGAIPSQCLMAGNSVRSDILPVLETGAYAALVPYPIVWSHEAADAPVEHPRFREFASLAELPDWIETIV